MSPKSIARTRGILALMDDNELAVLRNYLQCFESRKKGHKPKTLILLDLLEKYPDDKRVVYLLKKKVPTEDARRMLLSRLTDKMLTSLTLDVNIDRPENYDEAAQARARVTTGKVTIQLLIARGQRQTGMRLLRKIQRIALQFELFHDLVELQLMRMQYGQERKEESSMRLLTEELQKLCQWRDAEMMARISFDEVTRLYGFKGLSRVRPEPERIHFVTERANELYKAHVQTGSATVGYYALLLRIEMYQLQGQLDKAGTHLNELSELVENNPSIRNRVRLATAYANMGGNDLWSHRFSEAEEHFSNALKHLREQTRNHGLISEYLFYAQFYAGRMHEARTTLHSIRANPAIVSDSFKESIVNYLGACLEFCTYNHSEVTRLLARSQAIEKDREGWNLGHRILAIMNSIERGDLDHADSLTVNLRQFVRDGLRDHNPRQRDLIIAELLVRLRGKGYDFAAVAESHVQDLSQLYSTEEGTAWHVQTPELVCFHQWFSAKAEGRPFVPSYNRQDIYS